MEIISRMLPLLLLVSVEINLVVELIKLNR